MSYEAIRSHLERRGVNSSDVFGDVLRSCRHKDHQYTIVEWVLCCFLVVFSFASIGTAVWHRRMSLRKHPLLLSTQVLPTEAQLYERATEPEPPATAATEDHLDFGERPARTTDQD